MQLDTLSDRLKLALISLGKTQAELARRLNVKPQTVNYLCNANIRKSQLTYEIADVLGISGEWLANGEGYMHPEDDPNYQLISSQNRVPIILEPEIKLFFQNNSLDFLERPTYLFTTTDTGDKGFAIKLQDKSMFPRFDQDILLIINPSKKPKTNEYVLAYIEVMDSFIFRQIVFYSNDTYLKPINTDFFKSILLSEKDNIIGTLVEARWKL